MLIYSAYWQVNIIQIDKILKLFEIVSEIDCSCTFTQERNEVASFDDASLLGGT